MNCRTGAPKAPPPSFHLGVQLHCELQDAGIVSSGDLPEVRRTQIRAGRAEARARRLSRRCERSHEVRMVQDIERFETGFKPEALSDLECTHQRGIDAEHARSP